jgi:hypothetical protein
MLSEDGRSLGRTIGVDPALPDRPAGMRVGKMHAGESAVGLALLHLPSGPAVVRRDDRAGEPDRPAGAGDPLRKIG